MKTVAARILPGIPRKHLSADSGSGFTLLEVLVALVVLAVGASITMSVISGSLGNVRKAQIRTRAMATAQNVMEYALSDENLREPATYTENLTDGFHCVVMVDNYYPQMGTPPESDLPVKLLRYTVEMYGPDSTGPEYELQTLKLVNSSEEGQQPTIQ